MAITQASFGEDQIQTITVVTAADFSAKQFYAITAAGALPTVQGQRILGLTQDLDVANGAPISVQRLGISKAKLAGPVSVGDLLTTDTAGKLVKAGAAGAVAGENACAIALEAGVTGDVKFVELIDRPAGCPVIIPVGTFALATLTDATDVLTTLALRFKGRVIRLYKIQQVAASTASKLAPLKARLTPAGGSITDVTTATLALTTANCDAVGETLEGAAATAADTFAAGDTLSIQANSVTTFVEGTIQLFVLCEMSYQ